jgi:hypothetical protein
MGGKDLLPLQENVYQIEADDVQKIFSKAGVSKK